MSPPLLVSVPQKGNTEVRPQDLELVSDSGVNSKKARAPHRNCCGPMASRPVRTKAPH